MISEKFPGIKTSELLKKAKDSESPSINTPYILPVGIAEGRGATVKDADGNTYLDLMAGTGVVSVGHCNPMVTEAIRDQAGTLLHTVDMPSPKRVELMQRLISIAPRAMKDNSRVLFASMGAEAVEDAVKFSKWCTKKHGIIAFEGAFHGRTAGALALTGRTSTQEGMSPLMPSVYRMPFAYCYRCPFGLTYPECDVRCADYVEHAISNPEGGLAEPAAIIVEPVQGSAKVVPPKEYLSKIRKICDKYGLLLIDDEIQTGFGRTGKMFAIEHSENVTPDFVVLGKGIADGFPIAVVLGKRDVFEKLHPGQHTSTFGGNALGCAAALATIDFIDKYDLCKRSQELGEYFIGALKELQNEINYIGDVRGLGLMIGMELVKDKKTKEPPAWEKLTGPLLSDLAANGLLLLIGGPYRNVLRILPPLVITKEQIDASVQIMRRVMKKYNDAAG
ncbi:MAG TPA: aspartate aminotransferase family protein [Nitrososphaerales archaeon]|nr:aspartate aminotransferase family protein [Nitrososphaerales archaeon]